MSSISKNSVELIDRTTNSVTVSWPEVAGVGVKYVLQYRRAVPDDDGSASFETLSNKLTSSQARKKNLSDPDGKGFLFRVGALDTNNNNTEDSITDWTTNDEPFFLLSKDDEKKQMESPQVQLAGSNEAILISWKAPTTASGDDGYCYELQMRENSGGCAWKTIAASLKGTEVRKKNLSSTKGYQFRVRQVGGESEFPFSPPSEGMIALGLSDGLKRFFSTLENGTLLRKSNEPTPVPLCDVLGGKEFVLLYASAHWCGPCRQFTPQLTRWYQTLQRTMKCNPVEVVFLSADHDEAGFKSYYSTMPWAAVDHDDDAREQIMGYIKVTGIPRLVVLDGRTGRILENNAVGKPLDVNHWRSLRG